MDVSTHNQIQVGGTSFTLDVTAAPDPSALVSTGSEPLLQLRALEHPGDPIMQSELFKIFLTDDAAAQVQALLRLEEGDTGLDLLFPLQSPNWAVRVENLPDTGTRFTRLDVDSRLPSADTLDISPGEAAALAGRIDAARQEREVSLGQMNDEGDERGSKN